MASRVSKTRNAGTMTEAGFWGWLRSALRKRSQVWKPVQEVKKAARREYKGENTRQKYEYQCAKCQNWFADKETHVDHIIEAGSLTNGDDLKGFVERLFCEKDGLQVLCKICHHEKTQDKRKK